MPTGDHNTFPDRPAMTQLVLLPLTAWAAIHCFAAAVADPLIRAEGLFLAPWVAALAAVLLGVAPRPRLEAPVTALLATAVVWSVHARSTPAAAIGALLVIALAVACCRRLARGAGELDLPALCAAAIGIQVLVRPELFLTGQPLGSGLLEWLVLPLAGTAATAGLQRLASGRGLLVVLLAVALNGGWSPLVVLWIAAAAAAGHLIRPDAEIGRLPLLGWLAAAAALGWQGLDQPALLLALTAAGVLVAGAQHPRVSRTLRLGSGVVLLAGAGWLVFQGARNGWPGIEELALLGVLLPTLAWSAARRPRTVLPLLSTALLGVVALPAATGLAPALLFLASALPRQRPLLAIQGVWGASVAGAAILLAGYPWLRRDPLQHALALFGADDLPSRALIAVAVAVVLGGAATWRASRPAMLRAAPGIALALPLLAVAVELPPAGQALTPAPGALSTGRSIWRAGSPAAGAIETVVVESYLTFASKLPAGEPVARVVLEAAGEERAAWILRAGEDTGEWAAGRPDIAAQPGFRAPPPWIGWIEPEGRFFGYRYRTVLRTAQPVRGATVSVQHTAGAEDVELVLTHVEARP